MDNQATPPVPPIEIKPETGGSRKKIIIISAIAGALIVAAVLVWFFVFYSPEGAWIKSGTLDEEIDLLLEPGYQEALDRNISGADKQFLYSLRGTFVKFEQGLLYLRIESSQDLDGEIFVEVEEKSGSISDEVKITKMSPDPDNPGAVLLESAGIGDISKSDKIEIRAYQNLYAADEFTIEEIDILY
jgi:hypothetical protein